MVPAEVVGPVEVETLCQENVAEFAAAGTDPLLLVHVVMLSVGLSPTASLDGRCFAFLGFRGFVASWQKETLCVVPELAMKKTKHFPWVYSRVK